MNIYNCCCLCLEEDKHNGDSLIWIDGMQLCESWYKNYTESDYYAKIIPLNAIKRYRRMIADITEEYKNEQLADLKELNNYIRKDKIREKIKELEENVKEFEEYWSKDPRKFKKQKSIDYYKLEALQELLEKNNGKQM